MSWTNSDLQGDLSSLEKVFGSGGIPSVWVSGESVGPKGVARRFSRR